MIGCCTALGDDPLQIVLAGMAEDGRSVAFDLLGEADNVILRVKDRFEGESSTFEAPTPQVVAIEE